MLVKPISMAISGTVPKMEPLYHVKTYCGDAGPYIDLIYGRYLQLSDTYLYLYINTTTVDIS